MVNVRTGTERWGRESFVAVRGETQPRGTSQTAKLSALQLINRPDAIHECNYTLCRNTGARWSYFRPSEVTIDGAAKAYCRTDKADPSAEIGFCEYCGSTAHFCLTDSAVTKFGNTVTVVNCFSTSAISWAILLEQNTMIDFYAWDTPNARKISVVLEEMSLPYRVRPVDITQSGQHAPAMLAISPNSRIPAIVDQDGPNGLPLSVFESGAILLYLGEKTGRFLPAALRDRVPVLEWLMWQVGGFGPMPGQVHHFLGLQDATDQRYGLARYTAETRRLYGVLNSRLATVDHVAGALSVADFAVLGWVWRHERHRVDLAEFPHVSRWYAALLARPGVQRGLVVDLC